MHTLPNGIKQFDANDTVSTANFNDALKSVDDKFGTIGQPNGIASLGADGKVPSTQLPSASTDAQTLQGHPASDFVLASTKGQANGVASLDGTGNVPASQLGNVNAATTSARGTVKIAAAPSSGDPVAVNRTAIANDVQITGTSAQQIASYTPPAKGNFVVYVYFRVVTGTTNVTITVTYADGSGVQTNTMLNAQTSAVGSYSLVPLHINATNAAPINVNVTANVANQVYASASIVGV